MTTHFRLYILDRANEVRRSLDVIAASKDAAMVRARTELQGDSDGFAYELWQNARRVSKELAAVWTLSSRERRKSQQRSA